MGDLANELRPELLLRHVQWLRRLARRLVLDAASADDLVQQTLLEALAAPAAQIRRPRAWLSAVLRRVVWRVKRAEEHRLDRELRAARPVQEPATDEVVARTALHYEVVAAVLALEEHYRTTVLLRYFEDLKPREIASRMAVPVETVRTRLKRGIELLRERIVEARGRSTGILALLPLFDAVELADLHAAVLGACKVGAETAGATAVTGFAGAVIMSLKAKLLSAGVVVLAAIAGVWQIWPDSESARDRGLSVPSPSAPEAAASHPESAPDPTREAVEETVDIVAELVGSPTDSTTVKVGCELVGTVRTVYGAPATGATVLLEIVGQESAPPGWFGSLEGFCNNGWQFLGRSSPAVVHWRAERRSSDATRGENPRALVASDGAFRFVDLPPGSTVNLGALHAEEGVALAANVVIHPAENPKRIDLTLVPGVIFYGSVTDQAGEAIPNASIELSRLVDRGAGSTQTWEIGSTRCADDGQYRSFPYPFQCFIVRARADGCFEQEGTRIDVAESERERRVDFEVERATTLTGRLVGPDGVEAGLAHFSEDRANRLIVLLSEVEPIDDASRPGNSASEGVVFPDDDRYEITPRQSGLRFVSAWFRGNGWSADALLGTAEVVEAGRGPDLTVDLGRIPPAPLRGSLVIEAVGGDGRTPVPSFRVEYSPDVTVEPDAERGTWTRSFDDPSGVVRIESLSVGVYELIVWTDGYGPWARRVRVDASPAENRIRAVLGPANASIAGQVDDETQRPVAGATIALLTTDGAVALPGWQNEVFSDADGSFDLGSVGPGTYFVVASADGYAPAGETVHVTSHDPPEAGGLRVHLRLTAGFEIRVHPVSRESTARGPFACRIFDERGAPVYDGSRRGFLRTWSGVDSALPFRLAAGIHTIEVFSPGIEAGSVRHDVVRDESVDVELHVSDRATSGRMRNRR